MKRKISSLLIALTIYAHAANASEFDCYYNSGMGNDRIFGSFMDDKIRTGWGQDILNGREGNDSLEGELGSDFFVFDSETAFQGVDTIEDFDIRYDHLDFSDLFAENGQLEIQVEHVNDDTIISAKISPDIVKKFVIIRGVLLSEKVSELLEKDIILSTTEQMQSAYQDALDPNSTSDNVQTMKKQMLYISKEMKKPKPAKNKTKQRDIEENKKARTDVDRKARADLCKLNKRVK